MAMFWEHCSFNAACPSNSSFQLTTLVCNSSQFVSDITCVTCGLQPKISAPARMSVLKARPSLPNMTTRISQEMELDSINMETLKNKIVERSLLPSTHGRPIIGNAHPALNVDTNTATKSGNHWERKTLLTLDGGGVRGYSSLLILQEIMKEIMFIESISEPSALSSSHPLEFKPRKGHAPSDERYLPSHYFDCIAGTSTGG